MVLGNSSVGGTGACNSVVIGNSSSTTGPLNIVIGANTSISCDNQIVLGNNNTIQGTYGRSTVLIGSNNTLFRSGENIIIGNCSVNTGSDDGVGRTNIVIGNRAAACRSLGFGVVLGNVSIVCGYGVVIGSLSCTTGTGSGIAIGAAAIAAGNSAHVGNEGSTTGICSTTIGNNSSNTANCANILGANNTVSNTGASVIGFGLSSEKDNTVHVNSLIAYGQAASKANAIGSTGTAISVNWDNSNVQTLTITASGTLTMSNPIDGGVYTLQITQGGSGSNTITWSNVKWPGGTPPTLSTAAGATDILTFIYGPTAYFGNANLNFS